MKPTFVLILILIFLVQLMTSESSQCSLDSMVDKKIKEALNSLEFNPSVLTKFSCTSITSSGRLASCPAGMSVTGCACGYACGSWDVQSETTCHCQCSVVDWATARCCHLV
ncbi:resistin-like beta isoform X2 [Tupaia chinensis]|nr:resistin-like beta isoform X2 [Tupaia chinensis]